MTADFVRRAALALAAVLLPAAGAAAGSATPAAAGTVPASARMPSAAAGLSGSTSLSRSARLSGSTSLSGSTGPSGSTGLSRNTGLAATTGLPAAATAGVTAAARAEIPCPKPKVAPPKDIPPRPVPPSDNPADRVVGGPALATHGLVVPAGATAPPAVTATTWLVADLDTGQVLGACGPHVYQTPASVQKTLLAATVMDKLDPNQVATVVPSDLNIEYHSSAVGIVPGGRYPISILWLGLLLNSGNDAANALARLAGGGGPDGVAKTVAAMNAEARRLGAFQTHAVTPSGLDGKGQFTSAYDLALIAREDFAKPDFRKYVLTRSAEMPAQPKLKKPGFQFQNENKLIFNYPGALGGKTGFTTVARTSYMSAAQRDGRRLVVTLLGAEIRPLRGWQQGAALLDWGFSLPRDASVGTLVTPEEVAARSPVESTTVAGNPAAHPAARPAGPSRALSVTAAASVAVVLAAAPLMLLTVRRRRRTVAAHREPPTTAD